MAMIPAEFAEPYHRALTRLQSAGPAMPASEVHHVLDAQLGTSWRRRFRELDHPPHRAEADRQRAFAAEFADDPYLRVPRVVASAPQVIVSEWLDGGIPPVLVEILRRVTDGDADATVALMRAEGFVARDVPAADVLRYIGGLADPLRAETFHFHRAWIARQGARVVNVTGRAYRETGRALAMPAEHMMVMRVLSGWTTILAQLGCTVAARKIAQRWMPGFA